MPSTYDLTQIGAQSYSFREFDVPGTIACMQRLELRLIEYCAVHFPPDADAPGFAAVKQAIDGANLKVCCFGVESFTGDDAANRRKFAFAQAFGIGILTADPAPESFDGLERLCEEFQVKVAIHNHGPSARYDKAHHTLDAVRERHPLIGACIDTGHVIRSGEAPHDVIERMDERCLSLHLKDWKAGGEECIVGEGDLDLAKVVVALKAVSFSGPIVMEYELSPNDPVPDMRKGMENWLEAVSESA